MNIVKAGYYVNSYLASLCEEFSLQLWCKLVPYS